MRHAPAGLILVALFTHGSAAGMQRKPPPCISTSFTAASASSKKQAREFQKRVEAGPLYGEIARSAGPPEACEMMVGDGEIRLVYSFRSNAKFEAQTNPSAEIGEQHLRLNGVTEKRALTLLKAAERDSFGREGCGIDWDHAEARKVPDRPGFRELVYRGEACNCQARLVYRGNSVCELILSSAC